MRRIPAVWKVVKHDNATFLLASVGVILVAIALFVKMTGTFPSRRHSDVQVDPQTATSLLGSMLLVVGVLWIPAAFRILRIRGLFESGNEVRATVRKIQRFKGYCTIDLDFLLGGRVCAGRSTIRRSAKARTIGLGSQFGVIVDPSNPSRLVLAGLYD